MRGKRLRATAFTVWLVIATGQVLADGKMFWPEKVPPDIPYQRALILFEDGVETLVLQSQYKIPKAGDETTLGWVVPVPTPPEMASMHPFGAYHLFWDLSRATRPRVISLLPLLDLTASLVSLVIWITFALIVPSSRHRFIPQWLVARQRMVREVAALVFLVSVAGAILLPALASAGGEGVDIVSQQQVGIYDVRVIRARDSAELIAWLNEGGFAFGNEDRQAFESYLSRGWCFVVATIAPEAEQHEDMLEAEGLAAPLILRFPHEQPIYPLALTGTGGYDTEILIYLASTQKMTCGGRLRLRYAREGSRGYLAELPAECETEGFFDSEFLGSSHKETLFFCKFKGTLTPTEMAEDLVFTPAKDDKPYRERVFRW